MGSKHARLASDAPMSQADFCSHSEPWRITKTHGMDWAFQKLSEGPEKNPQPRPVPPLPKQLRKAPEYYRDSSLGSEAKSSSQPKTAAVVQGESTRQLPALGPRNQPPGEPVGDTSKGDLESK
ncbi:hypothetical protein NDU88_005916 [Pleurodeles waltl]|uniref:Uncharacterized protein n=1 Tax=Pleurodeles waltl TaxID=8319 RepID=A0AAV7QGF2_PLEWA|nr:hypothetical protein NDU88_005916 [Pleurodeles waltl]